MTKAKLIKTKDRIGNIKKRKKYNSTCKIREKGSCFFLFSEKDKCKINIKCDPFNTPTEKK